MKISQTVFNLQSGHKYMVEMAMFSVQRAKTPKVGKQGLQFMGSARCLIKTLNLYEVSSKYLKQFPTYRADTSTWKKWLFSIFRMFKGP